ncbi:PEP-CTERM system histidine kinase PrsK [Sphingomonas lutea]|uniref:histidine kinase n=1 Tax=Sphingomonas lutea TaxID=1045317 RepID=A0A7G9SH27_9SPHN|nr:XrtA/PEP-CTERM system histidine kinase PrsK [Sphingomonas lutea]QNN67152.1 PEP-CTERM system histidine kinase PrsK [Sphingomonas lutea]
MNGLVAFWSYALAACLFVSILLWQLRAHAAGPSRLLLGAYFATAVWASVSAIRGPVDILSVVSETIRNLAWIVLLHSISGELKSDPRRAIRLVFGAVALALGIQLVLDLLLLAVPMPPDLSRDVLSTAWLLRISLAAGALVLLHNVYGQAAPESRVNIRSAMLGLALIWGYDLNLYTLAYLDAQGLPALFNYRGLFVALIAPLFVAGPAPTGILRIRLSRAATFQSISLLTICVYFAVMAVLATALRRSAWDWGSALTAILLATMMIVTAVVVLSQWARGWVKVKLSKHLFEHRYDYRSEWLRFTETLGRAGPDAAPLGERIVQAFAEIADSPGGLLLAGEPGGSIEVGAEWNWRGANPSPQQLHDSGDFWSDVEARGRILEFEGIRHGWANGGAPSERMPHWLIDEPSAWAGIPLVHQQRLVGVVILAAPEYRRALDWEDFDLLRTAGAQAASSLAEAQGQDALVKAQRFEEFNRRFAFILHDVKNLVSQLSLLSRNAKRHADNPDFHADMVATLRSSVAKMNDLLARLSPHAPARVQSLEPQPLRPILSAAIAAKRRDHDIRLLGDSSMWANVDASALEQALGHILQNAVDASTTPVVMRVTDADPFVTIAISDKGCGMDGDFVRNRLFQPFVSTKSGGFGIGSFEARSLIAAMGGHISVDSRPGQGTTFSISVPAAEPAREPQPHRQRKRA